MVKLWRIKVFNYMQIYLQFEDRNILNLAEDL